MGKSKAALPDLTKVIELKMDFTAVSASKLSLKENLKEFGRGNLSLKVRASLLGIAGEHRKLPCMCSRLGSKNNPKTLESKVCVKEEEWVHLVNCRSLAVTSALCLRKTFV